MKEKEKILLAHGGGGRLMQELVAGRIVPALGGQDPAALEDAALLPGGLAFTTDAYVVRPPVFPGGDLGRLAVYGTCNDLAVRAARPRWLSLALIIEEGTEAALLDALLASAGAAAREAGVSIVTGDTKVVERGAGDGVYAVTSGVGVVEGDPVPRWGRFAEGDAVLLSGPVAEHGAAVLLAREGLSFETALESDAAPVWPLVELLLKEIPSVKFMRDPTRGGLAAVLCELAPRLAPVGLGLELDEAAVPVAPAVRTLAGLLGLDPLHIACEGRFVAVVGREDADRSLAILRSRPLGREAALIGGLAPGNPGRVVSLTRSGGRRLLTLPAGELLPRIC